MPLHFTQSCPTCGRRLQVHTRLLGQQVACQHCHAQFYAGATEESLPSTDSSQDLLARAEVMLKMTQPIVSRTVVPTVPG
jgi:ribosomal protein L37AE/L43A